MRKIQYLGRLGVLVEVAKLPTGIGGRFWWNSVWKKKVGISSSNGFDFPLSWLIGNRKA